MSVTEPPPAILPFRPPGASRPAPHGVLAVVGGALDAAVLNLARALAHESAERIDLLQLVEVPIALPLVAYGHHLLARGAGDVLDAAVEICGDDAGDAAMLLCRHAGRALAAEAGSRNIADLVIGAPEGGWWARRRAQAAITHVQKHAACRVFVVHVPAPPVPAVRHALAR